MEQAQTVEKELNVEGMTCAACAATIRNYLEGEGMTEVYVDLPGNKVSFRTEHADVPLEDLATGITRLGYKVSLGSGEASWFTLRLKVYISAFLTAPLLAHHLLHLVGSGFAFLDNPWVHFGLALPIFLIGLFHFGRSAWGALRHGQSNMDVLIFLGSSAAFGYSCMGIFLNDPTYNFFETSAMIITLVLVGNLLEEKALRRTTSAISDLESLKTESARLWMGNQQFMTIPAADLRKGDKILVNHGEAIPVDGIVLEGEGEVNESILTGESVPSTKLAGMPLLAGSTVISGNFIIQATVNPADTVFNQIIRLVKAAQSEKPQIQRLADRISAWFVPIVVVISVFAFFLGTLILNLSTGAALMNAIAVLVISCPCAMGLATPTAIIVGMGRLSRNGLLIKGAQTIEHLAGIRQILFDKTGTLTTGKLKVHQIKSKTGLDAEVRQYLYQLELRSNHPLAASLIQYLGNTRVNEEFVLKDIIELPGKGMTGNDHFGRRYTLGRDDFDRSQGYHLALIRDDEKIAHIFLEDELRPDAPAVIDQLHKKGYATMLVSGDHTDNVRRMATLTGIPTYYAEQLPQDKYALIEKLGLSNDLAMVGDGINDAPALEKATVGIAMAGATYVALQSARVALLRPQLNDLLALFSISKLTVRTIKENLFWAFSYNIVAIPLAVAGYLNPMWGAIFMAFSDLIVIGNSIRLKYRKG